MQEVKSRGSASDARYDDLIARIKQRRAVTDRAEAEAATTTATTAATLSLIDAATKQRDALIATLEQMRDAGRVTAEEFVEAVGRIR